MLDHREDDEAFQTYLDRFTSEDAVIFPAPQSIDDLENFPELHQQNLERLRKQCFNTSQNITISRPDTKTQLCASAPLREIY
ncbi:DUF6887 family protein [Nostoc sp.]|uniref:DUF6887 family protein n=1 Tax=Nostoc sp. TaxID=1180 RepID=UPI003FA579CA